MKSKKFISIIWGYHNHLYTFAPEENYHFHILKIAKELGYKPYILLRGKSIDVINDPNFDSDTQIIEYRNFFNFIIVIIKYSFQNSLFYVNSLEWQSFIVPFLARKTIFMAHTQPKRHSKIKQKIQNFVYRFFSAIRLNNSSERDFLITQGINHKKLFIVPLVVSQNIFKIINQDQIRSDLVYFGNVTPVKNVCTIIEAFKLVKKQYPEIKLHIIGNIWDDTVNNKIKSFTETQDIIVHGFLPMNSHLNSELNRRLIFLNSSLSEGQCVAVYDAALSGCVLCLPKIMSFTGVFKDNALFHDSLDHNQLALNIIYYIQNPDLVTQYRQSCVTMIKSEYNRNGIEFNLKKLILKIDE